MITYVDRSLVRAGRLAELRAAITELAVFIEANEPMILAYNVYFDPDGSAMTVVHLHADAASLAFHLQIAGPRFPAFAAYVQMQSIDIYGEPGDDVVAQLRAKAQALGSGIVRVHNHHAGFNRVGQK
ncbi:hypothetical protein AB0H43_21995 [Hamadaea sp. NPDC050747]|uniref:hypothetical protein n=1 Tax=Hamadaea sp. NPDC050747 TaxID=3155789 RepID=UPI0033CA250B